MRVTGGVGAAGRAGGVPGARAARMPTGPENGRNFDKISIVSGDSFQKQLLGKLSQEVRAATTTGTVSALREQVREGAYEVDPHAIARKLLFVWEA